MASNVRDEISKRIFDIRRYILEAHENYTKYLKSGENANLNEYSNLLLSIDRFYYDKHEQVLISPRQGYDLQTTYMYEGMKNHRMLRCRWAIKKLDRELAKKGIVVDDLIKFEDPFAVEMQQKVNGFKDAVVSKLSKKKLSSFDYAKSKEALDVFVNDLCNLKLYDLQRLNLPEPSNFAEDVVKEVQESKMIAYHETQAKLLDLNAKYLEYKNKGEDATYGEYVELYDEISNITAKIDPSIASEVLPQVIEDLKKQKIEIASGIDEHLFMISTDKELACRQKQNKFNEEVFDYFRAWAMGRNSQKALEKVRGAVDKINENVSKLTIKEMVEYEFPNPKEFVDELLKINQPTKPQDAEEKAETVPTQE